MVIVNRLAKEREYYVLSYPGYETRLDEIVTSDWLDFAERRVAELTRELRSLFGDLIRANSHWSGFFSSPAFVQIFERVYGIRPNTNDLFLKVTEKLPFKVRELVSKGTAASG